MPNDLETFLATLAICCFQDKFSPIITPRKTVSLTRSIEWLLNVIDKSYVFLICLGLKIMKFDFLKLIETLLAWNHSVSLDNSKLIVFIKCEKKQHLYHLQIRPVLIH